MTRTPKSVVLVGGLAMRAEDFSDLARALNTYNIESVVYDNINVGVGPRSFDASILAQADHGWATLEGINPRSESYCICGISMGGMIASTMAAIRPQHVSNLIVIATSANTCEYPAIPDALYKPWIEAKTQDELFSCVEIAFGRTALQNNMDLVQKYFHERLTKTNKQSRREFISQLDAIRAFDGLNTYQALATHKYDRLLISGSEDRLFPKEHAQFIESFVNDHIELPQTGHMIHLENPFELARIIAKRCAT